MEQVIKAVLDADNKANAIVTEALKKKAECDEKIANAEDIRTKYTEKAKKSVSAYEIQKQTEFELQSKAIHEKTEIALLQFDKKYNEKKTEWVDTMFRKITE